MDKILFDNYKKNKRELKLLDSAIQRLYDQLDQVPEISGKVTKSSDDFPYIEEHITVRMAEPKEATEIKEKIREKESRKDVVEKSIKEVENFIAALPEGIEKSIFEMVYLDGRSRSDVGEEIGYTQGRISQIIIQSLKD